MSENPTPPAPRARVRFWGTRGTCASPGPRTVRYGGNTPCVEVRGSGGPALVLDAGTGIRALGQHMQRSPLSDEAIHLFLTHRHADHVIGLPHFAPLHARTRSMHVWCGDCAEDSLPSFLATLVSPPLFPAVDGLVGQLLAHDWPEGKAVPVGEFLVHRFGAHHPGEAAIIRVDDASGPVMAYAPDNELAYADQTTTHIEWLAALREFLHGVPLLVHDATYTDDELPSHVGWGHSTTTEAVRLAVECGVGTLALFHHHPDRDDDAIERIVESARVQGTEAGSSVRVLAAWEGLSLSV